MVLNRKGLNYSDEFSRYKYGHNYMVVLRTYWQLCGNRVRIS